MAPPANGRSYQQSGPRESAPIAVGAWINGARFSETVITLLHENAGVGKSSR